MYKPTYSFFNMRDVFQVGRMQNKFCWSSHRIKGLVYLG
jgi:hypothetical protein